ncbi:uncharacterized protein [Montipora foliosa]|uniref:uncharacterized protein isoform X6 n=1 Tax=Montipora foliosa TaxID=591990 RepID=UPI0035F20D7B
MIYALLILLSMVGLHSTNLLSAVTALKSEHHSFCSDVICPPGFLSVCPPEEPAGCKPCKNGTFSSHKSRKKACKQCSVCQDNEFQVLPCTPMSDVVCQKCRECSFRFGVVLQSCTRTSDTICGNCSSGSGCGKEDSSEGRGRAAESFGNDVLPEPTEHDVEDDGNIFSPDFAGNPDKVRSKAVLLRTPSFAKDALDFEESPLLITVIAVSTLFFVATGIAAIYFLVCKGKKQSRTQCGSQGRCFSSLAESGIWRPRCPRSRKCCTSDPVSSIALADQADKMLRSAGNVNENDDSAPSSAQETVMSYLPDDVMSVLDIFPPQQGIASSFPQFVTHAEGIFNINGGILTHPDSNVSINIEHGTFPDGHPQPIFFNVIHDDTYVIRDVPETDERTLISPVIHCGPHDINPNKAIEIVVPHCLYVDEVKKGCITVYRCGEFPDIGPWNWEKIPSASEKNCHSNAWFSVKKDCIYIKTKTFSIWCVFACGGPKRKRATVFSSKPNPSSNLISLRFYIYSDNEDSKKRVERTERERFPGNNFPAVEKPFKMFNDNQDITVWLDEQALDKKGWELDETPAVQNYTYEMAYKNGFRSRDACQFAVKPIAARATDVDDFSCCLHFQQENRQPHFIYVQPVIPLLPPQCIPTLNTLQTLPTVHQFHTEGGENNSSDAKSEQLLSEAREAVTSTGFEISEDLRRRLDEPVTRQDCVAICRHIVSHWKLVLRHLGMGETDIENIEADHRHAHEKSFQGLLAWTRSTSNQIATMRKLCNALHAAGCTEALEILSKKDADLRLSIPENSSFVETFTSENNVV